MNCQGQRTLYIKANGEMPCEDNIGEQVDQILFVATHSVNRSRRHTNAGPSRLPIVTERAAHNATPILYRTDVDASATPENTLPSPFLHLVVDEDKTGASGERHIRGWAVGDFGCTLERVQVLDGDQVVGELATGRPFTPGTARPAAGLEVDLGNGRVLRVPIEADPVLVARMATALER